jgi:hypothetical protein
MAGAIVQNKHNSASASATSIATGEFGSNVTSGNYIYIVTTGDQATVLSIAKNAGTATIGSVTTLGELQEAGTLDVMTHAWCLVTGSGTLDLIAEFEATATERCIMAIEVSGVSAVDTIETNTGSNPTTTMNVTVGTAPAFAIAAMCNYQGGGSSVGTGFSLYLDNIWTTIIGEGIFGTQAFATTGAKTANFVNPGVDRNNTSIIVFTDTGDPPITGGPNLIVTRSNIRFS